MVETYGWVLPKPKSKKKAAERSAKGSYTYTKSFLERSAAEKYAKQRRKIRNTKIKKRKGILTYWDIYEKR